MITVANRLYVKQEFADAFEKVFRERAGLVDKMDGFISNQVLRPVNEGDPYVVFTTGIVDRIFLTGCGRMHLLRDMPSQQHCRAMPTQKQMCWSCTKSYRIRPVPT